MRKTLSEEAIICVKGKWRELKAVLVSTIGGYHVIYLDRDGLEVHRERAAQSHFKEEIRQIKKER